MFLFHGTWENILEKILREKKISNYYSCDTTEEINQVFLDIYDSNPREYCIYLSKDSESADAYDYAFKIDTNKLNKNLLYVGNYNIIDKIYSHIMSSEKQDREYLSQLVNEYVDTMMSFEEYEKGKDNLSKDYFEEFLYFEEIKVSKSDLD